MPLLPSASDSEPFLILTDQDYRKAMAPEAPAPTTATAPKPRIEAPTPSEAPAKRATRPTRPAAKAPSKRWGLRSAVAAVLLVLAGSGFWWTMRGAPEPTPVIEEKPVVRAEPTPAPAPPRAPRAVFVPAPVVTVPQEEDAVEERPSPTTPLAATARGSWYGGRAWIRVSLKIENRGQVRELRERALIAWDGQQYVVKPAPSGKGGLWVDQLQILLNLPWPGESWPRTVTSTTPATLEGEGGTFDCDRVEGEDRFPEQRRPFTYWVSPTFPPGAVRARVSFPDLSIEYRLIGYGPDPGGE